MKDKQSFNNFKSVGVCEARKKLLICTFSGGRTSAFMARYISLNDKYQKEYNVVYVFANTGKEKKETLDFIRDCEVNWGLFIVWLEAAIQKEKGVGTTFKMVDYNTASKNGEPFEAMLQKYPMPNNFASNCTRELKQRPIEKFAKSLGYDSYFTAMGIREDEAHRRSNNAERENIIYPLMDDIKVDAKFIRNWWSKNTFDLQLKDYEGNCDLCFKKSVRKRLTLINENPKIANWWQKMEDKYSSDAIPRFDLRSNLSIEQLVEMAKQPFTKVRDVHELGKEQCNLFEIDLDIETDCFCKAV